MVPTWPRDEGRKLLCVVPGSRGREWCLTVCVRFPPHLTPVDGNPSERWPLQVHGALLSLSFGRVVTDTYPLISLSLDFRHTAQLHGHELTTRIPRPRLQIRQVGLLLTDAPSGSSCVTSFRTQMSLFCLQSSLTGR